MIGYNMEETSKNDDDNVCYFMSAELYDFLSDEELGFQYFYDSDIDKQITELANGIMPDKNDIVIIDSLFDYLKGRYEKYVRENK